ncbi:MAG: hypothetical protein JKY57_03555 [Kordiimonadaceae bacterium]|nr:hypothetical protein [Kordiimonadaceae bacterium]
MSDTDPKKNHTQALNIRGVAVRTFMAVTLKNRPFDVALDDMAAEANLSSRDRAFVLNLLMLCLRRYGSLKKLLNGLLDSGLPRNATWTEAALLTGLAQILLMRTADHAAVNETVDLVKSLPGKEGGFSGLVNAVLRKATRQKETLVRKLNAWPAADLPKWLFDSWSNSYGSDTANAIATTLQSTPMLDITLHPSEDKKEWAKKLEAELLPTGTLRRALCDVTNLPGYDEGIWWIQDMAAAIPATLLGDINGKNILDLCAAPGGKTLQLAAAGGIVTAVDRSKKRLTKLESNLARTNLKAQIFCVDAARYIANDPIDHILLDAPCTATGTLRRNPDVIWTKSPADVEKLSATQARILEHAFNLLPKNGTLMYCVCSLEEAEGLRQINTFLAANQNAQRLPISALEVGGISEIITSNGDVLCLPSIMADKGGMDGFYVARITKVKSP